MGIEVEGRADASKADEALRKARELLDGESPDPSFSEMEAEFERSRPERRAFYRNLRRQREGKGMSR